MKTENQKAWFFVLPVLLLVAFNALIPMMTVVNYSVQETFGNNVFFWEGLTWFEQILRSERFHNALGRNFLFTFLIVVGAMWNIFTLPEIGLLGYFMNHVVGISYDMTQDPLAAWVTIVTMDVWHWTSLVVLLSSSSEN